MEVRQESDLAQVKRIAPRTPDCHTEARRVADGFLKCIAERYFAVTSRLMRERLPHHLNLGTRLTSGFPDVVAEVAGRHVDVLSINLYTRDLAYFRREVERLHKVTGKPILVSEFSFPARLNRSGNSNKGYEQAEVADDPERGRLYARCLEMLGDLPFVVGCHWFQYYDEPTQGRKDGECSNFGFLDVHDQVYEGLADAAAEVNHRVRQRREGDPERTIHLPAGLPPRLPGRPGPVPGPSLIGGLPGGGGSMPLPTPLFPLGRPLPVNPRGA